MHLFSILNPICSELFVFTVVSVFLVHGVVVIVAASSGVGAGVVVVAAAAVRGGSMVVWWGTDEWLIMYGKGVDTRVKRREI